MDVKRKEVGGEEGSEYLELPGGLKRRLITVYLVTFLYDFIHVRIEKGCRFGRHCCRCKAGRRCRHVAP